MTRVALTFDNGPDPVGTPRVLDALERHGVPATFFVLGRQLDAPGGLDLARAIRDAGHALGNHSYTHQIPLGEDPGPEAVARELARTHARLEQVWAGPWRFRPFGRKGQLGAHLLSVDALRWLEQRAYDVVLWNAIPGDFSDYGGWMDTALAQLDDPAAPHRLMVLHDAHPGAMVHLDAFLTEARARGHTFVADLPQDCLPMVRGLAGPELSRFVSR